MFKVVLKGGGRRWGVMQVGSWQLRGQDACLRLAQMLRLCLVSHCFLLPAACADTMCTIGVVGLVSVPTYALAHLMACMLPVG